VWDCEIEPHLVADAAGVLEARTLLERLMERRPGEFQSGQLRTLQRRMREWRALHGPEREVMFEQQHVPGREAQMDFTHAGELGVTIAGEALDHLLYEFVLSYSGWRYVEVRRAWRKSASIFVRCPRPGFRSARPTGCRCGAGARSGSPSVRTRCPPD
jgi:hypothetical protein